MTETKESNINENKNDIISDVNDDDDIKSDILPTLYYIESETELSSDHYILYKQLRQYRDDIISKKIKWYQKKFDNTWLTFDNKNDSSNDTNNNNNDSNSDDKILATQEMIEYLRIFGHDTNLVRCLTGGDYKIDRCKEILSEIVQWRVLSKVDNITPLQFKKPLSNHAIYSLNGYAKTGHPIIFCNILAKPLDNPWDYVAACIYTTEKAIKLAKLKNMEQALWIVDVSNLGYSTVPPRNVLKDVIYLLQSYYCQRMYKSYIAFSPFVFRMIWNMFSPFINKYTKRALRFLTWDESKNYDTFKHEINRDQLPKKYGGTCNIEYTYQWELKEFNQNNGYKNLKAKIKKINDDNKVK